jgi:glycosyltransferase involved in cell wall biosynthesis
VNITTSVIITAHNYARFLPRCLKSVLGQTRPADQIIVVDDGSTDQTPEVVSSFPAVRYIWQANAGKAAAFNRGFNASEGDLICHLDADDYWLPEKLKRVTEVLSRCEAGGMTHDSFIADQDDKYLYGSERPTEHNPAPRHFSFREVLLMCFVYRPGNSIRGKLGTSNTICAWKEAVADIFDLPAGLGLAVDGALLLGVARRGLLYLPEKLSTYRHHGHNCFVGNAASYQTQRRLFEWVPNIPGATSSEVKSLCEALVVEMEVQSALRKNEKPFSTAYKAAALNIKLLNLGLVPNWKHLATPVGCLVQWERIRNALFHVS